MDDGKDHDPMMVKIKEFLCSMCHSVNKPRTKYRVNQWEKTTKLRKENTRTQQEPRVLLVRTVHLLLLLRSFSFFSVKIPDGHSVPEIHTRYLISVSWVKVWLQNQGFTSYSTWKKSLNNGFTELKWLVLTFHVGSRRCNRKEPVLSLRVCSPRQNIVPKATMIQCLCSLAPIYAHITI